MNNQSIFPESPYHPLSSLIIIILDNIWSFGEITATATVIGLPIILLLAVAAGVSCGVSVTLNQRYLAHEMWGAAIAKGVTAGIIAAIPYSITGTSVGAVMLAWAGLYNVLSPGKEL
ncbi:MAG TPA: hypothetical protein PKE64_25020 [Anaerolineae bacterium]|nr:hypothetical protein [Anaerolineae bacterium]